MIVTSSTLLGLVTINGAYEIHLAMLIMLLWNVRLLTLPTMPTVDDYSEDDVEPGLMYKLCVIMHVFLCISCFMN